MGSLMRWSWSMRLGFRGLVYRSQGLDGRLYRFTRDRLRGEDESQRIAADDVTIDDRGMYGTVGYSTLLLMMDEPMMRCWLGIRIGMEGVRDEL